LAPMFSARLARGAGCVALERIPYIIDRALALLSDVDVLVLVGASPPVAFFAYPGKPGVLAPETCSTIRLTEAGDDVATALENLRDAIGARPGTALRTRARSNPEMPAD